MTARQNSAVQEPLTSARPLRLLMVCARYFPDVGGTETHVNEVAQRLSEQEQFDVTVLATDRTGKRPRRDVFGNVKVLRVRAFPRTRDYYLAPGIAAAVAQPGRWDLIHCQGIHTPVPILAMLAARHAGIPYMVTFHTGGHTLQYRNALRAIQWRMVGPLLRNAVSLVGVSTFEAEVLSNHAHLGGKPVTVIYNGGTLPEPDAQATAVRGRIISTGRLERYKGHQRVIEALPYVMREVPDAHLVVLGKGPYEPELRKLAQRLGLSDRVQISYLPPDERGAMAAALAQASVVAAFSDYEAHPVAVIEALSAGRPVVGYDNAGMADLVAKGWVRGVTPGSPPATAARMIAQAMTSPSPPMTPDLPTWDSCAAELGNLYLASANRATA